MRIAGVDGCRAGWVVADDAGARVVASFADIVASGYDIVGVDMPVGLPDAWHRAADREARAFLRPRGSTVFPTPPRRLLAYDTYADANAASKDAFGKGLPRQSFNLFAKMREVDEIARRCDARIVEIHPECSLVALTATRLAPKRTAIGRVERVAALERIFGPIELQMRGTKADDVLDAHAVLWSARRYAEGRHRSLGDGATDRYGTIMQIVM